MAASGPSSTSELRPYETAIRMFANIETNPLASVLRGLVFLSDLKDTYFHIQISPNHRPFLRFAFEGVAYQYTVLPFGLSLAPHTFTKCKALSPRQKGVCDLNYLDNWLILAQLETEQDTHRSVLLSHLESLGIRISTAKSSLCSCQQILFLGAVLDSVQMGATFMPERALTIQRLMASFKVGFSP